ncbi:MAG: DNA adenine methylase [Deltaproteobacteria bacterium]
MPVTEINAQISNEGTREDIRRRVVELFLNEKPGKKEDYSNYIYFVETLSSGNRIYLKRPANLKKGFDFRISVENIEFSQGIGRRRDYPKHDDVLQDLTSKRSENQVLYSKLFSLIEDLYTCKDLNKSSYTEIRFSTGYPVDLLLGVIKWFFIEQDIRDWNYSGRHMFFSAIPKPD